MLKPLALFLPLLAFGTILLMACGGGDASEPEDTRTPAPTSRVIRAIVRTPTPTPSATPTPAPAPEEELVYQHHVEGPLPEEELTPVSAPVNPAPLPPPDVPITDLLHPPPYTVFIDAGHGGLDSGAYNLGLAEKDVNLDVAIRLAQLLGGAGYNVVLDRWGDYTLSAFPANTYENRRDEIQARVDVANQVRADVLISIHFNGGPQSIRGLEIYYNPDRSFGHYNYTLADVARRGLLESIRNAGYDVPDRGIKNDAAVCCNPANPHSWILGTNDGFRPSLMPGIIGEAMFLSNDFEAQLLWQPEMRQAIAGGYRAGIDSYFAWIQSQLPPTPAPTPESTPAPTPTATSTPSPAATPSPSPILTPTPTPTTGTRRRMGEVSWPSFASSH